MNHFKCHWIECPRKRENKLISMVLFVLLNMGKQNVILKVEIKKQTEKNLFILLNGKSPSLGPVSVAMFLSTCSLKDETDQHQRLNIEINHFLASHLLSVWTWNLLHVQPTNEKILAYEFSSEWEHSPPASFCIMSALKSGSPRKWLISPKFITFSKYCRYH